MGRALANGAADLDPLTRARLDKLSGHSVAIDMKPLGEAVTLSFDNRAIRFEPGIAATPSVIVRGSPAALTAAFFSSAAPRGMTIEGDEVILTELRSIVRSHPESVPPSTSSLVLRLKRYRVCRNRSQRFGARA